MNFEHPLFFNYPLFKQIFERVPLGYVLVSKGSIIEYANERFCEMLGYSLEELRHKTIDSISHPEDNLRELELAKIKISKEDSHYIFEKRYIRADESHIWVKVTATRIFEADKAFVLGMVEDISHLKKTVDELRFSETNARALLDASTQAIVMIDQDESILFFNRMAFDTLKFIYHKELSVGAKVKDLVPPDLYLGIKHNLQKCLGGKQFKVDRMIELSSGQQRWFGINYIPIYDEQSKPHAIFFSLIDISEKIKSESKLRLQDSILKQVRNAIIVLNSNGTIIYWNSYAEKLYGWSAIEAIGKTSQELGIAPQFSSSESKEIISSIEETGYWEGEFISKDRSGRLINLYAVGSLLRNQAGQNIGRIWVETDISNQKNLESQLAHAQKMESIGTLTGGIAHDFNNLLMAIGGTAELLQQDVSENPTLLKKVTRIQTAAKKASALTEQLLNFSQKQDLVRKPLSLEKLIEKTIHLLQNSIDRRITIKKVIEPSLPEIIADSNQIEQILFNLTNNSKEILEPMLDSGHLGFIEISAGIKKTSEISNPLEYGNKEYVVFLKVADNGTGIPKELKSKVFDPFFTTKPIGKGSGLGLSVVYGIVKNHKGGIEVDSEEGKGTTVSIYFPEIV
ncbi:MAG: PAS domain S-box protein [Chloroherpetonaceae bacterium]|nr:PAS domain S-box protein [Chloroherpetonaceae bacterium]